MAARGMGLYPQPSALESLFWVGPRGGGGWRLLCAPTHAGGGGVAGWSSVRLGRKNPVASPGARGPLRGRTSDSPGGDSAIWYGTLWFVVVVVVVVKAPSTCRWEKLPDTLPLGRAQGSSRPAVTLAGGVCRQRPRGGGGWGARRGMEGGGGCARTEEGGATCVCYPGALPRSGGGRGDPTCA